MPISYESVTISSTSHCQYVTSSGTLSQVATASSAGSVITAPPISGYVQCGVYATAAGRGAYNYVIRRVQLGFDVSSIQKYGTVTLTDDASYPNLNKAVSLRLAAGAAPANVGTAGCYAYFTPEFNATIHGYYDAVAIPESPEFQLVASGRSGTYPMSDTELFTTSVQPNVGVIESALNNNATIGIMIKHEHDRNYASVTPTTDAYVNATIYPHGTPPQLTLRVVPRTLYFGANF